MLHYGPVIVYIRTLIRHQEKARSVEEEADDTGLVWEPRSPVLIHGDTAHGQ